MKNERDEEGEAPAAGRRILVVDDNLDSAESLALLLGFQGHEVKTAVDGPAAITAALSFRPDIVFLDIGLPGMDGYEVARKMRAEPSLDGAFLIAMTGYGREEDVRQAMEAGFDRHLVKPMDFAALDSLLRG